jgi:hemerythrin-like domain-containing protein
MRERGARIARRSVAVLAAAFGIVTVFVGSRVLAGREPGFVVFRPLLVYNIAMGVIYVLAGWQAWRDARRGRVWAGTIAGLNLLVLLVIAALHFRGSGVAVQSLWAMTFRTIVWGSVLLVLSRVGRRSAPEGVRPPVDEPALRGDDETTDYEWVIRSDDGAPTTVSACYAVDHDEIDALFERFRELHGEILPVVHVAFREFKTRLERHIGWEEDILFPLFERLTGMPDNGPTVVMRGEHRQIKAFLDAIDRTLQGGDAGVDADQAALLAVLAAHNWKEEHILYPLIDRQVSAEDRESVFARMRAETGWVPAGASVSQG